VNSWHHVVASGIAGDGTTKAGRVSIFLDGKRIASQDVPASIKEFDSGATESNFFKIGGGVWNLGDVKFTGYMDDVFFSPWAYSEYAIQQMSQ
jgi:hypothetical protein